MNAVFSINFLTNNHGDEQGLYAYSYHFLKYILKSFLIFRKVTINAFGLRLNTQIYPLDLHLFRVSGVSRACGLWAAVLCLCSRNRGLTYFSRVKGNTEIHTQTTLLHVYTLHMHHTYTHKQRCSVEQTPSNYWCTCTYTQSELQQLNRSCF